MNSRPVRFVDSLINPRVYRRAETAPKRLVKFSWRGMAIILLLVVASSFFAMPKVQSVVEQLELLDLAKSGRYLVLFQNDAEIRSSGGFIGSFAVVEASERTIKPLYFETNVYKLDDPFTAVVKIDPPKPLRQAIGERGWALRDSNFAADFRAAASSVAWFFAEEAKNATGLKKAELDRALAGNYQVDGVIATNLTAFLEILDKTGSITIPNTTVTVDKNNFFQTVQQIVEKDYFTDPANKDTNEPKTILQNLFPAILNRLQTLPKTTQYKLAKQLLDDKKVIIYVNDPTREQILLDQGWAGALDLPADLTPKGTSDWLGIIRSSHAGNKSSIDINPIYRYSVTGEPNSLKAKLEITFEHKGTGIWPSGVNQEYLRVLTPTGSSLARASRNGQEITGEVDIGHESNRQAFGFWLKTEPRSSQTITLEYNLPKLSQPYSLVLFRQPGGNDPDLTVLKDSKLLFQGRLSRDRVLNGN